MTDIEAVEVEVTGEGRFLNMTWSDDFRETLPVIWLCDNATDSFDEQSGQRRKSLSACDPKTRLSSAAISRAGVTALLIDGRTLAISHSRLRARRRPSPSAALWLTAASIEAPEPLSAAAFIEEEGTLAEVASRIMRQGLALLTGGPRESGFMEQVVARFGFIRETNYGRLFDVRSEPRPSNLAYTGEALDLHTDNPYRDPPPTLQLLHAIRADADGGATCFADGFAHARALEAAAPRAFRELARTPVEFAYRAPDGAVYRTRRPMIEQGPDGTILTVRLNHRSLAPLDLAADRLSDWYDAYRAFHDSLHAPGAALSVRLSPGDVALFDNRRIVHGRESYDGGAAEGRWLQGCYADIDGLLATLARLRPRSGK